MIFGTMMIFMMRQRGIMFVQNLLIIRGRALVSIMMVMMEEPVLRMFRHFSMRMSVKTILL